MSKLREKMVDVMQLCGLSQGTQQIYLKAVERLALHYMRSPDEITPEEVQAFLVSLLEKEKLSHSTQNCIVAGLRLFYQRVLLRPDVEPWIPRRRSPQRLPEILSIDEVGRLLATVTNPKHRALLMTMYSAGLRSSEALRLQLSDIDSSRMVIRIRRGKGDKDRYTILTQALLRELRAYWKLERPPEWLFPGASLTRPLNRKSVWEAFTNAKKQAGITKNGGVHSLRHCFATHLIEQGVSIRTVQALLGHSCTRSTSRYIRMARTEISEKHSLLAQVMGPQKSASE
jgi:integrase/recombinase XerD